MPKHKLPNQNTIPICDTEACDPPSCNPSSTVQGAEKLAGEPGTAVRVAVEGLLADLLAKNDRRPHSQGLILTKKNANPEPLTRCLPKAP